MRGTIFAVTQRFAGSILVTAATALDSILYVQTIASFDEDGGKALVHNRHKTRNIIDYTGTDEALNALTGVTGLDDNHPADVTEVRAIPYTRARYAEIQSATEDDTITARLPHHLYKHLSRGTRDAGASQAEHAQVEHDGQEWVVTDVLGPKSRITNAHASPVRILRYTAETLTNGNIGVPIDDYSGTALACRVVVDVAPTSTATFKLRYNGNLLQTLSIKKGHTRSHVFACIQEFVETDVFTVEQTTVADCGGNLNLYLWIQLDVDD